MTPEATLFVAAVDLHRTLMPLLTRTPAGRHLVREAYCARTDVESLADRFRESGHPDADIAAAAFAMSWAPAECLP